MNDKTDALKELSAGYFNDLCTRLDNPATIKEVEGFLDFHSEFHSYSMNNRHLIWAQVDKRNRNLPEDQQIRPTRFSSFANWGKMKNDAGENTRMNKGEKGYKILVPAITKCWNHLKKNGHYALDAKGKRKFARDTDGNRIPLLDQNCKQKVVTKFVQGHVFDLGQTNCQEIGAYKNLDTTAIGELKQVDYELLAKSIEEKYDLSVNLFNDEELTAGGYYVHSKKEIVVNEAVCKTPSEMVAVLSHELGHHILHGELIAKAKEEKTGIDKKAIEGEAEAFAHVFAKSFGVEAKSELYIRNWGNTGEELQEKVGKILTAVNGACDKLDVPGLTKKISNSSKLDFSHIKLPTEDTETGKKLGMSMS
ncbi:MAG: ImmA/IrrE family metallo-endopeptidase [Lentisphaeria bacterium]|nr:ImmA/IrrE family metallo-endopeptidase [Lentisphaeria bacterium]NQZ66711.1 ImmA/IrrE family metallo-endopeptidase [Lentisphaeria bacterium]